MSRVAQYLTHADRAQRRAKIKAELRSGRSITETAVKFGLTRRYICQIAQDNGLSSNPGRPRGARLWKDCPPHLHADYDFLIRRKRLPAAEVRKILEAAACPPRTKPSSVKHSLSAS